MQEKWKWIIGYRNHYKISNYGNIDCFKFKKTKRLKFNTKKYYPSVTLCKNGRRTHKLVHRLVAVHFLKNKHNKQQINHKDGSKNNNKVSNLEWVTPKENAVHASKVLGRMRGNKSRLGKVGKLHKFSIPVAQLDDSGKIIRTFESGTLARKELKLGMHPHNAIKKGCRSGGYYWKRC